MGKITWNIQRQVRLKLNWEVGGKLLPFTDMTVYLENQLKISYKIREFSQLARNESGSTQVCVRTQSLYMQQR
jgi:hypothetical protein